MPTKIIKVRNSTIGTQLIHTSLWYNTGLAAAAPVETSESNVPDDAVLSFESVSELTTDCADDAGAIALFECLFDIPTAGLLTAAEK